MKIIHVNKPMQSTDTIDPQIIDGIRYEWCVVSEMAKVNESFFDWWERKQEYILSHHGEGIVEGIFLYNVEGIGGIPPNDEIGKYPWALMIRYAWIKIKKDED